MIIEKNVLINIDGEEYDVMIRVNKKKPIIKIDMIEEDEEIINNLYKYISKKSGISYGIIENHINKIKDDRRKNNLIIYVYKNIDHEYYYKSGEILAVYLARHIKEKNLKLTDIKSEYNDLLYYHYIRGEYGMMKLLFKNELYTIENIEELYYILSIPDSNEIMCSLEVYNLQCKAFIKGYDIEKYKNKYSLPYDVLMESWDKIENRINFSNIRIYELNINELITKNENKQLLYRVCEDGLEDRAMRILEDEEKNINKLRYAQYKDDNALKVALEYDMKKVVYKMIYMREIMDIKE